MEIIVIEKRGVCFGVNLIVWCVGIMTIVLCFVVRIIVLCFGFKVVRCNCGNNNVSLYIMKIYCGFLLL